MKSEWHDRAAWYSGVAGTRVALRYAVRKENGDGHVQTAIRMVPSRTIERRDGGVPRPCRHDQPIPAVVCVALWWGQRTATF